MKISHRFQWVSALAFYFALSTLSFAHDTWLIPKRFAIDKGSSITLDMSSGMAFPSPLNAISPDRIDHALFRLSGQQTDLNYKVSTKKSLRFNTQLNTSGIAALWVELKPRTIELSPKKVKQYLHEIGADESVQAQWDAIPAPKRWRETYTKHAKTFVKVGTGVADTSAWSEPVGLLLEIVPETDPTTLKAGDTFAFRVLKKGKPLAHFAVGVVHENSHKAQVEKTDEQGRVSFQLNQAGRWLLRGTELRKSTQADTEWESSFTTLIVQVHSK